MEDKRREISLISVTHTQDAIGQLVDVETKVDVIATLRSVSLTEWTDAGQLGLSWTVTAACVQIAIVSVFAERGVDVRARILSLNPVVRGLLYIFVAVQIIYVLDFTAAGGGGFLYANF